ncbi:MAG: hypothetical protein IT427_14060 [Pirellulales bacterium]|nr:hypothetical protein [Pirellulales bacterium]
MNTAAADSTAERVHPGQNRKHIFTEHLFLFRAACRPWQQMPALFCKIPSQALSFITPPAGVNNFLDFIFIVAKTSFTSGGTTSQFDFTNG